MNFNVGDLILQKRDNITFTIVEKKGTKLILEYYDTHTMEVRSVFMSKNELLKQFKERPELLEHFKTILK